MNYLLCQKTKEKNEILTPVGCPLRCGPELMVSVDHGGKLFERLNGKGPAYFDERDCQKNPCSPLYQRVFDPATESIWSGITAAQGGFFCYFSCPSRKVKGKNLLIEYIISMR